MLLRVSMLPARAFDYLRKIAVLGMRNLMTCWSGEPKYFSRSQNAVVS